MEKSNNFILLPDIQRSPESEFPNLRVCDFIISELKKLKEQYGDETILVSLFNVTNLYMINLTIVYCII